MKFKTKINSKKLSVGFIGAGNMGLPMIKNIIKAGFDVKVFDWNIKVTKKLDKEKIIAVNNLRAVAKSDFIISMQIGRAHVRTPVTSQSRMPSSA